MTNTHTITLTYTVDHQATVQIEADSPETAARIAASAPPPPWEAWTFHPEFTSETFVTLVNDDFDHIPIEYDRTVVTCGTPLTPEHKLSTAAFLVELAQRLCNDANLPTVAQALQPARDSLRHAHGQILPHPPLPRAA